MAYEKQTWATGDIVTSAKLNHMEDGIYNASEGGSELPRLAINNNGDEGIELLTSFAEMGILANAFAAGRPLMLFESFPNSGGFLNVYHVDQLDMDPDETYYSLVATGFNGPSVMRMYMSIYESEVEYDLQTYALGSAQQKPEPI